MKNSVERKIEKLLLENDIYDVMADRFLAQNPDIAEIEDPYERYKSVLGRIVKDAPGDPRVTGPTNHRSIFGWGYFGGPPHGGPTNEAAYARNPNPENYERHMKSMYKNAISDEAKHGDYGFMVNDALNGKK